MLFRLGLALVLSFGLAVLLAWGWDHSDPTPEPDAIHAAAPATPPAR